MKKIRIILLIVLLARVAALPARADEKASWPCFRGLGRDNMSKETGLAEAWPKEGPRLIWTASGIGHGYSSVAVAGGRVFTAGMIERTTRVIALDLNGKQIWNKPNGESWQATGQQSWAVPYAGSRGTPTVDGETVYHLSGLGRLTAFDVADGEERWSQDLMKEFQAERPKYGFSESVLIHGDKLLCCPGGKKAYMAALDKRTGAVLWANTDLADPIGYASPIVAEIAGVEQVINFSGTRVFAVSPENGELLWQYTFGNERGNNATDVIAHNDLVYASSGYGKGSVLIRPLKQTDGRFTVEPVWNSKLLDNHHGGVLFLDGCLYGAGHEARGWFCLKFESGEELWQAPGKGSLTYADNRLYCLDEKGVMSLVEPSREKWNAVGAFEVPSGGRGAYWAHPVVCEGRLYVRHSENLYAYRIGKE